MEKKKLLGGGEPAGGFSGREHRRETREKWMREGFRHDPKIRSGR